MNVFEKVLIKCCSIIFLYFSRRSFLLFLFVSLFILSLPPFTAYSQVVTYKYDEVTSSYGIGHLTSVTDAVSGTTRFSYDSMGQVRRTDKMVEILTPLKQLKVDEILEKIIVTPLLRYYIRWRSVG